MKTVINFFTIAFGTSGVELLSRKDFGYQEQGIISQKLQSVSVQGTCGLGWLIFHYYSDQLFLHSYSD